MNCSTPGFPVLHCLSEFAQTHVHQVDDAILCRPLLLPSIFPSIRVFYSDLALSLFTFMHWRRKWQPTPVLLPGESQGWGSLVGCRLWGRTESDMTEVT